MNLFPLIALRYAGIAAFYAAMLAIAAVAATWWTLPTLATVLSVGVGAVLFVAVLLLFLALWLELG